MDFDLLANRVADKRTALVINVTRAVYVCLLVLGPLNILLSWNNPIIHFMMGSLAVISIVVSIWLLIIFGLIAIGFGLLPRNHELYKKISNILKARQSNFDIINHLTLYFLPISVFLSGFHGLAIFITSVILISLISFRIIVFVVPSILDKLADKQNH